MAGLEPELRAAGRHFLLRPIGLRYEKEEGIPEILGNDPNVGMVWDGIEFEESSAASTAKCIWDFISLLNRPPTEIHDFVGKWGLYDFGEDMKWGTVDQTASVTLTNLVGHVREVDAILRILAATEAEELVPLDLLSELHAYDTTESDFRTELDAGRVAWGLGSREWQRFRHDRMLDRWTFERQRGHGLALQRSMIEHALYYWSSEVSSYLIWDENGRRQETSAYGVMQIIAAQLTNIFMSTTLDVFVCSVCARPFSFETTEALRRPKTGAQRFCTHACRAEAKRQANLASWHKNKARWLRKGEQE